MSFLRYFRNNTAINASIRKLIRSGDRIIHNAKRRWRVSGILDMEFQGLRFKYFTRSDDGIADQLFYQTNYQEHNDLALFLQLARSGKVILDVGANTGLYSVLSAIANPNATIYSFEPHPVNENRLKKNISINNLHNVHPIRKACGNHLGEIDFFIPASEEISDSSSAVRSFSESTYEGQIQWKPIKVPQTTLSQFAEEANLKQIDLMKVDVESYEVQVFEGAEALLRHFKPIIMCEIFLDDAKQQFFNQLIERHGYTAYAILNEGLLRLDNGLATNFTGLNYLFATKRLDGVFSYFRNLDAIVDELKA